jgi:hypothetical protein
MICSGGWRAPSASESSWQKSTGRQLRVQGQRLAAKLACSGRRVGAGGRRPRNQEPPRARRPDHCPCNLTKTVALSAVLAAKCQNGAGGSSCAEAAGTDASDASSSAAAPASKARLLCPMYIDSKDDISKGDYTFEGGARLGAAARVREGCATPCATDNTAAPEVWCIEIEIGNRLQLSGLAGNIGIARVPRVETTAGPNPGHFGGREDDRPRVPLAPRSLTRCPAARRGISNLSPITRI